MKKKSKRNSKVTILLFAIIMLFTMVVPASADNWSTTGATEMHDPSIIQEGNTWYTFGTGLNENGLRVIRSDDDGSSWYRTPNIFQTPLSWWSSYVPNHESNQWAPDAKYFNGRYWVYYSVSTFGSNTSLIGLVSTTSITSGTWRDNGLVIRSTSSNNYNAIDGDLVIDANGDPWLSFGSFWSGIKLTKLDSSTMKPTGSLYSIASRSNNGGAIEAPNITYRDGYYHLFVSFDNCCQGLNSTYKIAYGRSTNITGPYYDKNGVNMMNGGGTILDSGNADWVGPGHQDVYNNNVIVRHAYDANDNGTPKLLINDLYWDSAGWPSYTSGSGGGGGGGGTSGIVSGETYNLVNVSSGKALDVWNTGTSNGTNVAIYTLHNNAAQKWTLSQHSDGTYELINPNSGKALDVNGFGTSNGTNVQIWTDYNNGAQKWNIIENSDGSYRLINPNSGKALDAAGTANGDNVLIWSYWGGSNQHWNIIPD